MRNELLLVAFRLATTPTYSPEHKEALTALTALTIESREHPSKASQTEAVDIVLERHKS